MVGRQGAQPVRGQELALVEQLGEQPFQLGGRGHRQQQPPAGPLAAQLRGLGQLAGVPDALVPQEPHELLVHGHRVLQHVAVDDPGGQRGDDPDHGPDLDRDGVAGRGDQPVVEQPVALVPQALLIQGPPDAGEMLQELHHQVLRLAAAGPGQGAGDGEHRQRVGAHPAGGVGLLQGVAGRQVGAVDRADVVQAEEAALEDVVAPGVFPVHPPGEVDQELVEDPGQEVEVAAAVDGPDLQRRPGVHRRVDVAEIPLIRRQRPVRVLEPFPAHHDQLVLGERRVQVGQGHGVEGQVPGGEPGILPLIRHGDDVEPVEVAPPGVPPALARLPGGPAGPGRRPASG